MLLLHNFLTPYRIPLFEALARRVLLDVWIFGDVSSIRGWQHKTEGLGFNCRLLPHLNLPAGSRDYRLLLNPRFSKAYREHPHDVTLCNGWEVPAEWLAAWHARRLRRPFVLWSQSTIGEANWRRSVTKPLVRRLVRSADAWVSDGTRSKEYLVHMGAEPARVFPAVNAAEPAFVEAVGGASEDDCRAIREQHGISAKHLVLYCGQLVGRKGLPDFVPAFAAAVKHGHDAALLIAGDGPLEGRLRQAVGALGITDRVHFAGHVAREMLPAYYRSASLFVLPSREEAWGMVLSEALASGVPVLTCEPVGAAPDIVVEGRNGFVVPAGDSGAMAAALMKFFGDEALRRSMRAEALRLDQRYSVDQQADAICWALAAAVGPRT